LKQLDSNSNIYSIYADSLPLLHFFCQCYAS